MNTLSRVVAIVFSVGVLVGCNTIDRDKLFNGRIDLNENTSIEYASKAAPLLDLYYPGAGEMLKSIMSKSADPVTAVIPYERLPVGWSWRYVAYDAAGEIVDLSTITLKPEFYETPKERVAPAVTAETVMAAQFKTVNPHVDPADVPPDLVEAVNDLLNQAEAVAGD